MIIFSVAKSAPAETTPSSYDGRGDSEGGGREAQVRQRRYQAQGVFQRRRESWYARNDICILVIVVCTGESIILMRFLILIIVRK